MGTGVDLDSVWWAFEDERPAEADRDRCVCRCENVQRCKECNINNLGAHEMDADPSPCTSKYQSVYTLSGTPEDDFRIPTKHACARLGSPKQDYWFIASDECSYPNGRLELKELLDGKLRCRAFVDHYEFASLTSDGTTTEGTPKPLLTLAKRPVEMIIAPDQEIEEFLNLQRGNGTDVAIPNDPGYFSTQLTTRQFSGVLPEKMSVFEWKMEQSVSDDLHGYTDEPRCLVRYGEQVLTTEKYACSCPRMLLQWWNNFRESDLAGLFASPTSEVCDYCSVDGASCKLSEFDKEIKALHDAYEANNYRNPNGGKSLLNCIFDDYYKQFVWQRAQHDGTFAQGFADEAALENLDEVKLNYFEHEYVLRQIAESEKITEAMITELDSPGGVREALKNLNWKHPGVAKLISQARLYWLIGKMRDAIVQVSNLGRQSADSNTLRYLTTGLVVPSTDPSAALVRDPNANLSGSSQAIKNLWALQRHLEQVCPANDNDTGVMSRCGGESFPSPEQGGSAFIINGADDYTYRADVAEYLKRVADDIAAKNEDLERMERDLPFLKNMPLIGSWTPDLAESAIGEQLRAPASQYFSQGAEGRAQYLRDLLALREYLLCPGPGNMHIEAKFDDLMRSLVQLDNNLPQKPIFDSASETTSQFEARLRAWNHEIEFQRAIARIRERREHEQNISGVNKLYTNAATDIASVLIMGRAINIGVNALKVLATTNAETLSAEALQLAEMYRKWSSFGYGVLAANDIVGAVSIAKNIGDLLRDCSPILESDSPTALQLYWDCLEGKQRLLSGLSFSAVAAWGYAQGFWERGGPAVGTVGAHGKEYLGRDSAAAPKTWATTADLAAARQRTFEFLRQTKFQFNENIDDLEQFTELLMEELNRVLTSWGVKTQVERVNGNVGRITNLYIDPEGDFFINREAREILTRFGKRTTFTPADMKKVVVNGELDFGYNNGSLFNPGLRCILGGGDTWVKVHERLHAVLLNRLIDGAPHWTHIHATAQQIDHPLSAHEVGEYWGSYSFSEVPAFAVSVATIAEQMKSKLLIASKCSGFATTFDMGELLQETARSISIAANNTRELSRQTIQVANEAMTVLSKDPRTILGNDLRLADIGNIVGRTVPGIKLVINLGNDRMVHIPLSGKVNERLGAIARHNEPACDIALNALIQTARNELQSSIGYSENMLKMVTAVEEKLDVSKVLAPSEIVTYIDGLFSITHSFETAVPN